MPLSRYCAFVFMRVAYKIGAANVLQFLETMTIFDILSFNKELLHRLSDVGIRTEDYRYVDLFRDFTKMITDGNKTTYAVAVLAEKYGMSERKVYGVIRQLRRDCKGHAV